MSKMSDFCLICNVKLILFSQFSTQYQVLLISKTYINLILEAVNQQKCWTSISTHQGSSIKYHKSNNPQLLNFQTHLINLFIRYFSVLIFYLIGWKSEIHHYHLKKKATDFQKIMNMRNCVRQNSNHFPSILLSLLPQNKTIKLRPMTHFHIVLGYPNSMCSPNYSSFIKWNTLFAQFLNWINILSIHSK